MWPLSSREGEGDVNGNGNQLGLYAYMLAPTPGQPPNHGDEIFNVVNVYSLGNK